MDGDLLTRCAADYVRRDDISCRSLSNFGVLLGGGLRNGGVGGRGAVWAGGDEDRPPEGLLGDGLLAGAEERHGERW